MQKWAGCFAVMLAVSFIAGCQSAKQQNSANTKSTTAAGPATTASAEAPAAAPAESAAPAEAAAPPSSTPAAATATAATSTAAHAATASNAIAVTPPVRIKCGVTEQMTDSEGNVWLPDQGYTDGNTYEVDDADITNTTDQALYRTERYGMSAYDFLVPNGKYTVKLLFAEVYSGITGPGDRVFSFNVQGHEFKDFDIWVKAGGFDKAYIESVDVDVTNGLLNITFTPNVENPKVDGIEILPRS